MRENDKITVLKGMLFALAALRGKLNELLHYSRTSKKRRVHFEQSDSTARCLILFSIRGKRLFLNVFLAIMQINESTLYKYASDTTIGSEVNPHHTDRHLGIKGKQSLQTKSAVALLKRYSELHSYPFPPGTNTTE